MNIFRDHDFGGILLSLVVQDEQSTTLGSARRKQMAHNHGSEYQVRIVRGDGTEELSGWLNSAEQVSQAIAACHRSQDKAYWLLERNVLCPNCLDRGQRVMEYPVADIPSPRCSPHDSRYLVEVGSKCRYELEVVWNRHRACLLYTSPSPRDTR